MQISNSNVDQAGKEIHLPDWRSANAAIRADARREKAQEKQRRRGEGAFKRVAARAVEKHPGDPHKQVDYIMANSDIGAAKGRERRVSEKRRTDLGDRMHRAIDDLAKLNVRLRDIRHISRKNFFALVRYWGGKGLKESTIEQYVDLVRRFMTLLGKAGVASTGVEWKAALRENGIDVGPQGRTYVALFAKGWRDCKFDPRDIIEQVRQTSALIACTLDMMLAFGLRLNEALQIQPYESDRGDHLLVYRGTKGGKTRAVRYSKEPEKAKWQRDVLDQAKLLSNQHPKRVLAFSGISLAQMKYRFRHEMCKHGLTRSARGITPHGLRHQFANDLFRELCGLPAPVLQLVPHSEYERQADRVNEALLEVSRQLGHERKSITGAYLGSKGALLRFERAKTHEIAKWLAAVEQHADVFVAAQVTEAWLVGSGGSGELLRDGEPLRIAVRFPEVNMPHYEVVKRLISIQAGIEPAVVVPLQLVLWILTERPHDGAEINFETGGNRGG